MTARTLARLVVATVVVLVAGEAHGWAVVPVGVMLAAGVWGVCRTVRIALEDRQDRALTDERERMAEARRVVAERMGRAS